MARYLLLIVVIGGAACGGNEGGGIALTPASSTATRATPVRARMKNWPR